MVEGILQESPVDMDFWAMGGMWSFSSRKRSYVMEQVLNDLWSHLYALMYAPFYDIYHLRYHLWSAMIDKYHKSFALIWIWTATSKFCLPLRELFCHPPVWVIPDPSVQLQIEY